MKKQWGLFFAILLSASQGFSVMRNPDGASKFALDQMARSMDLNLDLSSLEYRKIREESKARILVTVTTFNKDKSFESLLRFYAEEMGRTDREAHDTLKERLFQNMKNYFGAHCLNEAVTLRVYSSNFVVDYLSMGTSARSSPLGSLIGLKSDCQIQGEQKAETFLKDF